MRRADDDSLVQTSVPVNRFPDVVRYVVQRIKLFCPTLGKVKIAQKLARTGIHLSKTPVGRILKEPPVKEPEPTDTGSTIKQRRIVSKYPSHTWNADLTAVPISGGFWTAWIPNALWQRWPVCWWVLNVVDHYSRRSVGFAAFKSKPTSEEVTTALSRITVNERVRPKHLIVVPEEQSEFEYEVARIIDWYNEHRPDDTLGGNTPTEVHFSRPPANEQPRLEPRPHWPRGSPCTRPQADIDGEPGAPIVFEIDCLEGRRHLPIIRARRAA